MLEAAPHVAGPREEVLARDSDTVERAGAHEHMGGVEEPRPGPGTGWRAQQGALTHHSAVTARRGNC